VERRAAYLAGEISELSLDLELGHLPGGLGD
jgi:hypothetical protein